MREIHYYRDQAARAPRLARAINHPEVRDALLAMAKDDEQIAEDLELGAIEVRHPELAPQQSDPRR